MGKRKHKAPQMPAWFWYGIVDGCWCCKNRHNCNQCKEVRKYRKQHFPPKEKKVGMAKPIMMIEENNHESNKAIQ